MKNVKIALTIGLLALFTVAGCDTGNPSGPAKGTRVEYDIDLSQVPQKEQDAVIADIKKVLTRGANILGVSNPNVYVSDVGLGQRVYVELPDFEYTEDFNFKLDGAGKLDIKEINTEVYKDGGTQELGLPSSWKSTGLNSKRLKRAEVEFNSAFKPYVSIQFDDEGAKLLEEITARNIGKPVAIFVDEQLLAAPAVTEKISGGKAMISGKYTVENAKNLAEDLNNGKKELPIKLVKIDKYY